MNIPYNRKNSGPSLQLPGVQSDFNENSIIQKSPSEYGSTESSLKTNNMKMLSRILAPKDDAKLATSPSLSKSFNAANLHPPNQSASPHNQSLRQKICNFKPITPTNLSSKDDDDQTAKGFDFSQMIKSKLVIKEYGSPQKGKVNKLC